MGDLPVPKPCKSCGALVLWVTHIQSGKWMPMDADPVAMPGPGQFAIIRSIAWSYGLEAEKEGRPRFVSHFSTCPHAREWRQVKLL